MGDYFAHWLSVGAKLERPPAIFHVNWFRTGTDGRFLWPGFGQNVRVLLWMIDRVKGKGAATETPIGLVPTQSAVDWDGLDLSPAERATLLQVDRGEWAAEVPDIRAFFDRFGCRLPDALGHSLDALSGQLTATAA
jgi:phosphoenolpyruvate carboxykinase (GTP)